MERGSLLARDDFGARCGERQLVRGVVLEDREPADDQDHRDEPDVQDLEEHDREDHVEQAKEARREDHANREAGVPSI